METSAGSTFQRRAMGSPLRLTVVGTDPGTAERAWTIVSEEFEAAEQALSRFRESSDLTAMNREAGHGGFRVVDRRLVQALAAADRAGRLTGGRFDARILGALERLGYRGAGMGRPVDAAAGPGEISSSSGRWLSIEPRRSSVSVDVPVDLGGIGKGLALRWAWRALVRAGIVPAGTTDAAAVGALLEAGGDIIAAEPSAAGGPWMIGIEDPFKPDEEAPVIVGISAGAVTTSSVGIHHWQADDGRAVHHLVDPRTGEPGGAGLLAVSVAHADPAWAEVWSKTLFLAGAAGITELARRHGLAVWWFREDGAFEMTAGARELTVWVDGENNR